MDVQITALNNDCPFGLCAAGAGGGEGEGAALQGSNPSSYTELASGFSSTKLPPRPFKFADPDPYGRAGRGALNMSNFANQRGLEYGWASSRLSQFALGSVRLTSTDRRHE